MTRLVVWSSINIINYSPNKKPKKLIVLEKDTNLSNELNKKFNDKIKIIRKAFIARKQET